MIGYGSHKKNLRAKIFGGGEVLTTNVNQFHIGDRNIIIAREILEEEKIPITGSSLGGKLGRKIIFFTHTGEVLHRYIGDVNASATIDKDNKTGRNQ